VKTLLSTARVVFRLLTMGLWTASVYIVWQLGGWLLRGSPAKSLHWRVGIFRTWSRGFARLLGMRIAVQGPPPVPPYILVTNHLSYLDIILLASQLGCTFVSRHDVAAWPVVGHLTTKMGAIYIDRTTRKDVVRVGAAIAAALHRGEGVVLFAEGTSSCGARVHALKPSLLEIAVQAGQPVHYASLRYRTPPGEPPAHLAVCWWGDMGFFPHILDLLKISKFEAQLNYGAEILRETDRKILAQKLHARITTLFEPVVEMENAC